MPASYGDLERVMEGGGGEAMGAAYIPGTFPTVTVRNNMIAAGVKASDADVDRLWEHYYVLTAEKGVKPYHDPKLGGNGDVTLALINASGFDRMKVAAWLNATYKAVNEQNMGWRWLDPAASDHATDTALQKAGGTLRSVAADIGDAAGNLLKPTLDPVTNLVKYTAVAVVGAAFIYGVFQGVKVYKAAKRGKRKKGG